MRPIYFVFLVLFFLPGGAANASDVGDQLRSFLKGGEMTKVSLRQIGPLWILEGDVDLPAQLEDVERVTRALNASGTPVESLVRMNAETWMRIAERIEREIGSPEITARFVGTRLVLEGVAESDFEADRAVEVARTYVATIPPSRAFMESANGQLSNPPAKPGDRKGASVGELGIVSSYGSVMILDLMRVRPRPAAKKASKK